MENKRFNIRVYAIMFNEQGEVLLSHEHMLGTFMTKFPGGGLEYGEGTIDCLKREAMEEFGQEIEVTEHFYTTDYFQPALYFDDTQLISIYYRAKFIDPGKFNRDNGPLPPRAPEGSISFQWIAPQDVDAETMTFPIDKKVMGMIKEVRGQRGK
ncbi:MAG: NUDIX hydrolase [Breznakibacter sp.]